MTKRAIIVAVAAGLILAMMAPVFAQGPFADVPIDHWAYEAVSQLQQDGIIIGYPDGTFGGKRAMTRYEFALALSRAIPVIKEMAQQGMVTQQQLKDATANQGTTVTPAAPEVTQADLNDLKKSINEFRDELSGMGVDLDAVKRDVASLEERVAALEAEHKRLKITTKMNFFAVGEKSNNGIPALDQDGRTLNAGNNLLQAVSMVRDADVIFDFQNGQTKGKVVLNAGNYFSYLGGKLTDYAGGTRTHSNAAGTDPANIDQVSLFMGYGQVPILGADVTVGRFPIQFTKWTLKKFDVDSYTRNWKTDDGNYYVDGGKANWTWGGVDILAFAGKNNGDNNLYNLTSRSAVAGPFGVFAANMATGAGNIAQPLQSAGVRAGFGIGTAKVGLTYMSVGSANIGTVGVGDPYDKADIYGGDVSIPIGSLKLSGDYNKSNSSGNGVGKLDSQNYAWDVNGAITRGALDLMAGYKHIEPNFSAPGAWDKIGQWQNPTDIKGPYVGAKYAIGNRWSINGYGGFYRFIRNDIMDTTGTANTLTYVGVDGNTVGLDQAKLKHYKAGLTFQTDPKGTIGIEGEWVKWEPVDAGGNPMERYYTISYNRLLTDNSKLRLLYQFIDYDAKGDTAAAPYGTQTYKGGVAVAQVSMGF